MPPVSLVLLVPVANLIKCSKGHPTGHWVCVPQVISDLYKFSEVLTGGDWLFSPPKVPYTVPRPSGQFRPVSRVIHPKYTLHFRISKVSTDL